ncbi:hypothetical protein Glove_275g11 [Diversispora epigaea]|uniref:Protein kinase domain-containing protein n=1 Tax=Diversispora epigaea TaxID=1348612 RepID=A0A397I594_9GLOM|nr:hypothetical protein Glove_275g11 [Diversispora epigaea]
MSEEKTTEKEWETWMYNLIIEDTIQKEYISVYQYSEFENVKLIGKNIYKATFKTSQKIVALKYIFLNDKFTKADLINEIKRHRKLEIHNNILKFHGITKQENTNNYMIILEYFNEGSLRQYLKINFQKMNWNAKLNLAKQIANVLMCLHSNDIIHGGLNSENILIHNGSVKLNDFGLTKILFDSLRFFTNNIGPIQCVDPQYLEFFSTIGKNKSSDIFGLGIILWEISSGNPPFEMESSSNVDLLNNIVKGKREMAIPGTPQKYEEIYTDCWKHNGNSRPDISQVVKILSEISISNANVEFETPQSQPYNITNEIITVQLEKSNKQNKNLEVKTDPPFAAEAAMFIKDLFEFFINVLTKQNLIMHPIMIKNYIREQKKNPAEIMYEMIRYPSYYWFTSLIGFFYQHGIGTVVDNQMAFKYFNLAANKIDMKNISSNLSIRKFCKVNKEMGSIYLAHLYSGGIGVEKDLKKGFQIYSKVAYEGSHVALNNMGYCYGMGFGVEKHGKKAIELYLKSAAKGNLVALSNVDLYYEEEIGGKVQGFQYRIRSARTGNISALYNVGYCYENGIGVGKNAKEAFKWFLKSAEKGYPLAQYNLGDCYETGYGIDRNEMKAFEWFKKAAENNYTESQYKLGKCFYEGQGTKKDILNAIRWLNKAKENGNTDANDLLEEIISNLM